MKERDRHSLACWFQSCNFSQSDWSLFCCILPKTVCICNGTRHLNFSASIEMMWEELLKTRPIVISGTVGQGLLSLHCCGATLFIPVSSPVRLQPSSQTATRIWIEAERRRDWNPPINCNWGPYMVMQETDTFYMQKSTKECFWGGVCSTGVYCQDKEARTYTVKVDNKDLSLLLSVIFALSKLLYWINCSIVSLKITVCPIWIWRLQTRSTYDLSLIFDNGTLTVLFIYS